MGFHFLTKGNVKITKLSMFPYFHRALTISIILLSYFLEDK